MELPSDILSLLVSYFSAKELRWFRTASIMCLKHAQGFKGDMYPVKGPIKYWKRSFPNATCLNIRDNFTITAKDFKRMDKVETLDLSLSSNYMTDYTFQYMPCLKELMIYGSD